MIISDPNQLIKKFEEIVGKAITKKLEKTKLLPAKKHKQESLKISYELTLGLLNEYNKGTKATDNKLKSMYQVILEYYQTYSSSKGNNKITAAAKLCLAEALDLTIEVQKEYEKNLQEMLFTGKTTAYSKAIYKLFKDKIEPTTTKSEKDSAPANNTQISNSTKKQFWSYVILKEEKDGTTTYQNPLHKDNLSKQSPVLRKQ